MGIRDPESPCLNGVKFIIDLIALFCQGSSSATTTQNRVSERLPPCGEPAPAAAKRFLKTNWIISSLTVTFFVEGWNGENNPKILICFLKQGSNIDPLYDI